MKYLLIMLLLATGLYLSGCGKQAEEMKQAMDIVKNMPEKAEQIQQQTDIAEQKRAERAKRGDTLAMPFKNLQEYLPKSVSGYGEPKLSGQTMNMGGFSYSEAKARYEKTGGGEDFSIQIVDYNQSAPLYAGLVMWMGGWSMEDETKYERTFDTGMQYVWALEKYYKDSKQAEVVYAIGYRFLLTINADNQSGTDFLKSVAKSMKLDELSKM